MHFYLLPGIGFVPVAQYLCLYLMKNLFYFCNCCTNNCYFKNGMLTVLIVLID